jgi:NAD-dependent deacetylase
MVVMTGAGISAESGLKTFRDSGGLWEEYDIMEVATPKAWAENPKKVLQFYNLRRQQLRTVKPNKAHFGISELEDYFDVDVVTQNVDDLHERAGSTKILHLHGELKKVRSSFNDNDIIDWEGDLNWGDRCRAGHQLRPHVVWFGEMVPMLEPAAELFASADILVIIGTSLQVYPAAGLISHANNARIYYIDPHPQVNYELRRFEHTIIDKRATEGVPELIKMLKSQ